MDQRLRYFYEETRIKNASPAEMLVMLYDYLVQKAETAEVELAAPPGSAGTGRGVAHGVALHRHHHGTDGRPASGARPAVVRAP